MFMKLKQAGRNAQISWPQARVSASVLRTAMGRATPAYKDTFQGPHYLHSIMDLPAQLLAAPYKAKEPDKFSINSQFIFEPTATTP